MRIRSIHPEFWRSEDVAAMAWDVRLVFIGLWSYVDDNGVGRDIEKLIVAELFPLEDDPRETLATVSRGLRTLSDGGQITRYMVDAKPLLHISAWTKWQKIDKPGKARYPLPTRENAVIREPLATVSREVRETPAPGEGEKGRRGEERTTSVSAKIAPTKTGPAKRGTRLPDGWTPRPEDVARMRVECPGIDLEAEHRKFADYWLAQPGQKGSKLDWDATWRNWIRNAAERRTKSGRRNDVDWDAAMSRAAARDAARRSA